MENNENKRSKLTPEKVLEICNAINTALVAGKIVTVDNDLISTQIGGVLPGFGVYSDVHCTLNELASHDTVKVISTRGHVIRAYFPAESTVQIIYNPETD